MKEVLEFLLFTTSRTQYLKSSSDRDLETQLLAMAEDREVQAEITAIDREFLVTEIDNPFCFFAS